MPSSELSYHFAQAGNKEKAVKYALAAGEDALARWSNQEAISHFRYILETVGQDPECSEQRILALDGLAEAYDASNIFSEATKMYEQLCSVATGVLKLRTLRKAAHTATMQGNVCLAEKLFAEAEQYVELDRLEKARLLEVKAELYGVKGQLLPAMKSGGQALQIFEEEYSIPDIASCLFGQGFGYALGGQFEKGLASTLLSLAFYREIGDLRQQVVMHNFVGETFGMCFLSEESIDILEKGIEIEEKFKLGDFADLTRMYLALGGAIFGNPEQRLPKYLKAVEYAEKTDSAFLQGFAYSRTTLAYLELGDEKSAEKYYEKLIRLPEQALQSGWVAMALTKTLYYVAKRDKGMAMKYFNEHLDLVKSWRGPSGQSSPIVEALLKVAYSKILSLEGKDEEAANALQEVAKIQEGAQKRFEHVNLHASFMAPSHATVSQAFEVRADLINVSRGSASLANIQDLLPKEFQVSASEPEILRDGSSIQLKENKLEPFTVKTIRLTLQATKVGTFGLNPKVVYIDDLGQRRTCTARAITLTVKPAQPVYEVLPGRVTSGTIELDKLLLGGIPEKYAVVLASPSSDEREMLINHFLEAGAEAGETVLYITCEAGKTRDLAKQFRNFYLLVCNLQADLVVQDLPNVFKLKGLENLTDIEISIAKLFRTLNLPQTVPNRVCISLLSDVLLQHHAVIARKWLSSLLSNLKAKGFTTLAVLDPQMHPAEETQAVFDVFDGEIKVTEKETSEGTEKVLKIRKLVNQKYREDELILVKEKLST